MLSGSKSTVWLRVSPIAAARKSIAACAVGLAGVAAASAADIPLAAKATPPIIAPASWAGFYLGVHGGYGWGENNFREYLVDTSPFPFPVFRWRQVERRCGWRTRRLQLAIWPSRDRA